MAVARSAPQPSSPPRSPLGQWSKRLSKRAFKRTAQPAGPAPCWSSRSEGARGSGIFKGCQRPFRRGYSAPNKRSDDSDAILHHEPRVLLNEVEVSDEQAGEGLLLVTIDYTVRATNSRYNLVYPFYLREATGAQ